MLYNLIDTYSRTLFEWNKTVNIQKEFLNEIYSSEQIEQLFTCLIDRLIFMDRFWAKMIKSLTKILSDIYKYHKNNNLPVPKNFVVQNSKEIESRLVFPFIPLLEEISGTKISSDNHRKLYRRRDEIIKIDKELFETTYTFQLIPNSFETFELFYEVIGTILNINEKYNRISNIQSRAFLEEWENKIKEINSLIDKNPPSYPEDLYIPIQKILASINGYNKLKSKNNIVNCLNNTELLNRLNSNRFNLKLIKEKQVNIKIEPFIDKDTEKELIDRYNNIQNKMRKLNEKIKIYGEITGNEIKLLEVLNQMNPEFPVFLPRLIELVGLEQELTEKILKVVLQRNTTIGKYDDMSQVLMFTKPKEVKEILENLLEPYSEYACMVCQRGVSMYNDYVACPYCENIAHADHLKEWIKQKGICPVCKKNLSEEDIVLIKGKKTKN